MSSTSAIIAATATPGETISTTAASTTAIPTSTTSIP